MDLRRLPAHLTLFFVTGLSTSCDLPTGSNPSGQTLPSISLSPPVDSGTAVSDANGVVEIQTSPGLIVNPMHPGTVTDISPNCVTTDMGSGWTSEICGLETLNSSLKVGQSVGLLELGLSSNLLTIDLGYQGQPEDPLQYMNPNPYGNPGCGGACTQAYTGVSGTASAGLESAPVWLWGSSDLVRHLRTSQNNRSISHSYDSAGSYDLTRFFPSSFQGAPVNLVTPVDVIGASNAIETAGAEYNSQGRTVASGTIFRTVGSAYVHDYAVCNRFKGAFLQQVQQFDISSALNMPGPVYLFGSSASITTLGLPTYQEFEATAVIYDFGDHFLVSSRWISDEYESYANTSILTFQVWAESPTTTANLLQSLISILRSTKPVLFESTPLQQPNFFATSGSYDGNRVTLRTRNISQMPVSISANIVGYPNMRSDSVEQFWTTVSIPVGDNQVALDVPNLLNADIYLHGENFTDKVYVSDGDWELWSGGTPTVSMAADNCGQVPLPGAGLRSLSGCLTLTGTVPLGSWAGLARVVTTPTRPFLSVAATGADALEFVTSGTPAVFQVHLETTTSQSDGAGSYVAAFQNTAVPSRVRIPLSAFTLLGSNQQLDPAKLTDLTSVSWTTNGAPVSPLDLSIRDIAFTNSSPPFPSRRFGGRPVPSRCAVSGSCRQ